MVITNQADIVVMDKKTEKKQNSAGRCIPHDSNIKKRNTRSWKGLREKIEKMWKVKARVMPGVFGALGAVTPKLGERLKQIQVTTSEMHEHRSSVLEPADLMR